MPTQVMGGRNLIYTERWRVFEPHKTGTMRVKGHRSPSEFANSNQLPQCPLLFHVCVDWDKEDKIDALQSWHIVTARARYT